MLATGLTAILLASGLVVTLGIFGGLFQRVTHPDHPNSPVLTINTTISNDFADYIPYDEGFTPNAPIYSISPGLSNVLIAPQLSGITTSHQTAIETNGFVVSPQTQYEQIYDILIDNKQQEIPSFISSDAVLHAFHILYDLALREAEVYSFWSLIGNLTDSLVESSYDQYEDAPEGRWKDAALNNVVFFSVALTLLDETATLYPEVVNDVNEVLALIDAHEGFSDAWFMNYDEDFSQYVPRGHYTRSDRLRSYFKALMWYGRIAFRLVPEGDLLDNEKGMNETAQAILISLALDNEVAGLPGGLSGYDVWEAIYNPTVFFVGDADDLLPTEYLSLAEDVFGIDPTLGELDNDPLLHEFIVRALELREPLILSTKLNDTEDMNQTKGLRFMGQRYIPDSYILGQLVYKYVGTMAEPRLMPKGLDVMAALGSDRAWELLEDQKHFYNYVDQMEKLWNEVGNITAEEWTKNLYYLWLYTLLPLLSDPGEGFPLFMQSDAWVDKQLSTSLASWTELRHDTILYAKQSYTWELTGMPPDVVGYVEPVPRVYARLASLCRMMLTGLEERGLIGDLVTIKLQDLHAFLLSLREISIKELSGDNLNSTEIQIIKNSGSTLEWVSSMPTNVSYVSDADERMAVIADVHTDTNTRTVLEEGVGDPMFIYVAVDIGGQVVLTRGGVFSYYEFTQPMDGRLTDESWQDMLDSGLAPAMPDWTSSFVGEATTTTSSALVTDGRQEE